MPLCPHCQEQIDHVMRNENACVSSRFWVDEDGQEHLKEVFFEPENVSFDCPKCNETIARYSEEAVDFLKQGETGEEIKQNV